MNLKFYLKTKLTMVSLRNFLLVSLLLVLSFSNSSAQTPATAFNFNGTNAWDSVPVSPSLNISKAITIELWVKPTKSFGTQDVISKSSIITSNGYNFPRFLPNLDSLQFLLNINGYGWQTLSVAYGSSKLNQWHHVTATYDGIVMAIYIDGILSGTKSFAGTITVNNNPLSIGIQNGFTRFFGGSLDDIRIWSRSLSQCEIVNSMSCELAGNEDGLALYQKLNQGFTGQPNPTITTVTDATANNNTGYLKGTFSSSWVDGSVFGNCVAFAGPTASAVQSLVPVGGTIQLLGTGTGIFSWVGPNGFTSNLQNPVLTGATTLASGTYTLTVTNNGCSAIARTSVTVAWAAGALNFTSLGNKVVIPNNPSLNIASTITIETWINPSNTLPSVQNVISKSSSNVTASPGGYIFPRTEDGWRNFMFRIFINGTWRVLSAPYPSLNQWNHVAATYDGAVMKIYLNGTLAGSLAMSGSITYNSDNLTIGVQNGTTEYFQGGLDETRIWSRALTQCEIQNNISCELNGAGPGGLAAQNGLAAYFRYNQGLVNVDNTGYTTLADSSVNGNNGTLQGFFLNGLTSNWITGNVNATCSPYVGIQATAGSNGPNIVLGSTLNLTSSTGTSWLWTGPNGFTSTLQNPSIANVTGSNSGTYTVTIAGGGCNSSASTNVTVSTRAGTLSFDGVNDYVSVPSNQSLKGNKTITIESWIYPTNNTYLVQDVMSKSTTTSVNSGYIFPRTDDGWRTFSFYMQVGSTYQILSAPYAGSINQWHHVAATYDGFYMRLYLDGNLAASKEASGDILTNDEPLTIGTQPGYPEFFYGQVDETRIWNRPLTQCELINNMNCELDPAQKNGLAVYFKYNQGFLNAANTGVNTLLDASDNLNNGTLNNFALTGATSNWADVKVGGTCTVFIEPPVTATANASIYAVGSTIQFLGTGGYIGLGGNAYIWDGPNSFHVTTQNPVITNAQSNASGTYTLTAPFVNCVIQKSLKLSVSSLSLITASGPTTFCPSSSVTLSSSSTGSAYQWYRNAVLIPGATANAFVATQTGDYTVSITSINGIDILLSAPLTVTVVDNSAPVPNQLSLPTLNLFTPATVTSIPTASDDCRGTIVATTTDPLIYNTPGTYTIRWTYDDLNGHIVTQNQQVIVVLGIDLIPPVLTVPSTINLSANVTDCGATANFTATATDNSLLPVTITYSKNPGTIFPAGTTTVTVTATDASLNVTTKTFNVIVAPTTVAPITGTTSICTGTTTALASATTGGVWSSDNSAVASVNASGIVTGVAAGTANIKYTNNCGVFALAAVTIKAVPVTPVVTVTDNCGSSVLSTNASGSLLWSTGSSSSSITVSTAGSYTVTAGSNGCTSPAGSGTAAPKAVPTAPVVTVTNNCGSTTLSTNATGSLAWSNGGTTSSITVGTAGTYTVTQTVNGCVSAAGSGVAAPKAIPSAPVVTAADNCGTSVLSTNAAGTLLWSTGAATSSITLSTAGSYSVTQTVNGCVSASGSGVAAPKAVPATPVVTVSNNCGSTSLSTTATGNILWSNNATTPSINVTAGGNYSVTVTNGALCSATSAIVSVTVNANPVVPAISGNTTVSIGTTTQLANATSGGVWSSNSTNATVNASGLVTGNTGGTAMISYTVTGTGGCSTTVSTIITVITCTTPVFTVTPANITVNTFETGCTVAVNYTATASGSPASAYTYTFTGATIATGSGTGSGYSFNKGITTVSIKATNSCGSVTMSPFNVTVNGLAAPIIVASIQDAFCNKLTLDGSVSSLLNPTYRWVNGTNNTTYASGSQISLDQNSNDGVYQLYVTANGCTVAAAPYNYQKQNLVSSYTLLAKSLIDLGSNNTVASGSVGVINNGGKADFSSYNSVVSPGSFVKASKIDRNGSNINLLNPIYSPATGIVLPTMYYDNQSTSGLSSLTVSQNSSSVNGNYKNLTIKKGVTATVNGNNFGTIRIEQGAQVTFTSSMIYIDVLQVVKGPRIGYSYIRFSRDTKVVVSSSVFIGSQVFVNPDNKKVTFYVGGNNNGNDKHGDDNDDNDKNNKGNNDFMVKGGDTKVNANIFIPDGTLSVTGGYRYGDYGGGYGDCDKDDDEDKYYGQGNVNVYMTGLFIANEIDGNGKNVIWNSFDCSAAPVPVVAYTASTVIGLSQSVTQEKTTTTVSSEEVLKVTVMPNPSTTYFTLKFESKYETPVNMRVMDANGRVVDAQSKMGSNSTIQIGANYASGTYYAEMIQGTTRKVVQLIKIRG